MVIVIVFFFKIQEISHIPFKQYRELNKIYLIAYCFLLYFIENKNNIYYFLAIALINSWYIKLYLDNQSNGSIEHMTTQN